MSSTTCTAKQILGGLELYPAWTNQPQRQIRAMLPFIEKIPDILADYLDRPVTVRSWAEAKRAFNWYLYNHGFAEALCDCIDELQANPGRAPAIVQQVNAALLEAISRMDALLDGLEDKMAASDQTDRDLLTGPCIGLRGLALGLFDKNALTIADLLKIQPLLIVSNGGENDS